jgi:hypothetical protein
LHGIKLEFDSVNEALAINAFTRQRSVQFLSAIFAVVDPKGAEKAVKQYRGLLFPEEELYDLEYSKKAQETLEKLRKVDLRVKTI